MKSKFLPLFLFVLAVYLSACKGSEKIPGEIQKVENSLSPTIVYGDTVPKLNLEQRMKETGIKGLSIAVIKDYKIAWAKGYGWADEAAGKKVTTLTRFQAASISKSINSLGVLLLAEQGKIDLEADINHYLKSWKFPYDSLSGGKKITTANLLSHTGGLSIHGFPGYNKKDTLPSLTQILNGEKPANTRAVRSLFEPGLRFQYSGGGTTVSQLIVEDITGKKYADYMQEAVLKPLDMTNSSYQQPPVATANLTTGYNTDGNAVDGNYHIYPEQAAAGLWTTPTDLAKYIIECQLALKGESKKILSSAMMEKRMTPYIDSNAALGVFVVTKGQDKYFNHNGGNEAFLCTSYGSLENGNGVVIMINGENYAVISELLNSVAQVYNWQNFYIPEFRKVVDLPAETLAQYTGDYLLGNNTLTIKSCDDGLCIQQNGQPVNGYKMIFSDSVNFSMMEVPNARFKLVINSSTGKVEALELLEGGGEAVRLPRKNQ